MLIARLVADDHTMEGTSPFAITSTPALAAALRYRDAPHQPSPLFRRSA